MDDTIYRQSAIDALDAICDRECEYPKKQRAVMCGACRLGSAFDAIDELPSAERHGRWEHYEHREPQYDIEGYKTWAEAYKCSNCGFIHTVIEDFGHYAFCPNCGADMREAKNGCDDCFIPMFYNIEDDDSICRDCEVGE